MHATPELTVVLATFNGGERLRETLESMTRLRAPAGGWKLIVVDNCSTDNTFKIIESFQAALPMTLLSCPIRGKNAALNLAIPHFSGVVVLFTDDDVILPEGWLVDYAALVARTPQYTGYGGRIVPRWPGPPDEAIISGVSWGDAFAVHEADIPDGPIAAGKIWGPNMAVRTAVFTGGARFSENIGPSAGNYIPGSESSFNIALEKQGCKFYFDNQIIVQHQIRPEQLTLAWLKKRAYRFGKGRVVWDLMSGTPNQVVKIGIFPRWFAAYLVKSHVGYVMSWLLLNRRMRTKAVWNAMIGYGLVVQTIRSHRAAGAAGAKR